MSLFLLNKHLGVRLLGYMVCLYLNCETVTQSCVPFSILSSNICVLVHPSQHLVLSAFCFLILAILLHVTRGVVTSPNLHFPND